MPLYFLLLAATIAVPLILSFDKRLQFYKKWKYVLPSIFTVAAIYIAFDIWLTNRGVWGFNPHYLSGIFLFHLPIEEWLFFIVVAYASLFLHFSIVEYFPKIKLSGSASQVLIILLLLFCIFMVFLNSGKMYTAYIFSKTAFLLLFALFDKSGKIQSFFFTFLVILVPFIAVNGILTGSFIENEIVWYNNEENLGIRFFTIPVEDLAYAFSMLLFNLLLLTKLEKIIKT